jgi:hypothetical protein
MSVFRLRLLHFGVLKVMHVRHLSLAERVGLVPVLRIGRCCASWWTLGESARWRAFASGVVTRVAAGVSEPQHFVVARI